MNVNTLEDYVETVMDAMGVKRGFFESKKKYQERYDNVKNMLYASFHNVARSYHKIAVQNYLLLLESKTIDRSNKHTKKVNWTEIFKMSEKVKFKP